MQRLRAIVTGQDSELVPDVAPASDVEPVAESAS